MSERFRAPNDLWGAPTPWLSFAAIAYLEQLDFSDKKIFEHGAGASTLYWAARAREVRSVEHDAARVARICRELPRNCVLTHAVETEYVDAVRVKAPYDVIVVDGRWRLECVRAAPSSLTADGLIIFDNSERSSGMTRFLRDQGFIQVDFIGPAPNRAFPQATSFFLSRRFAPTPISKTWPRYLPGLVDSAERRGDAWSSMDKDIFAAKMAGRRQGGLPTRGHKRNSLLQRVKRRLLRRLRRLFD